MPPGILVSNPITYLFFVSCVSGLAMSAKWGTRRRKNDASPRNDLTSFTDLGIGKFCTAFTLSGDASIPLWDSSNPSYVTLSLAKTHFSGCSCKFAFLNFSEKLLISWHALLPRLRKKLNHQGKSNIQFLLSSSKLNPLISGNWQDCLKVQKVSY